MTWYQERMHFFANTRIDTVRISLATVLCMERCVCERRCVPLFMMYLAFAALCGCGETSSNSGSDANQLSEKPADRHEEGAYVTEFVTLVGRIVQQKNTGNTNGVSPVGDAAIYLVDTIESDLQSSEEGETVVTFLDDKTIPNHAIVIRGQRLLAVCTSPQFVRMEKPTKFMQPSIPTIPRASHFFQFDCPQCDEGLVVASSHYPTSAFVTIVPNRYAVLSQNEGWFSLRIPRSKAAARIRIFCPGFIAQDLTIEADSKPIKEIYVVLRTMNPE